MPTNPQAAMNTEMARLGIHPINPLQLMAHLTGAAGTVFAQLFTWCYMLSEIGILVGAFVFLIGAGVHARRTKGAGARMVAFSVAGFVISIVGPGVVMAISGLHL